MMLLDVEVVGQSASDAPTEMLAERVCEAVAEAFAMPAGQLFVKVRRLSAHLYAQNGSAAAPLPVFVRVLVRTRDPAVWPKRAETLAAAVAEATARSRGCVHVIFEPDASGRVFFGNAA
jgi:phenylpyruvate tautomerase PptA (4-oxalocrotonate tautomerase family)